jgi:hypothetical protein
VCALAAALAACTSSETQPPGPRPMTATQGRAFVARYLPSTLADRNGWATDLFAALSALHIAPTPQNVCAVIAVGEQESGLQVDPVIPNLREISAKALEREREKAGIPTLVLQAALAVASSNGKSYGTRIEEARTEGELSDVFEDFIDRVPLGRRFLADRNPVHTGGPMQVSVAFAQEHAARKPYPYPVEGSLRREVFSRRGGLYFGTAHLLDYPASYPSMLYRFADFNAGRYASRNAAFQAAVSELSGVPLDRDGDLVRFEGGKIAEKPGATELAIRMLAPRLRLDEREIRRDLEHEGDRELESTPLYKRVFEEADAAKGTRVARVMLPQIVLQSPKITRRFTTEGFARRVQQRYDRCLKRGAATAERSSS